MGHGARSTEHGAPDTGTEQIGGARAGQNLLLSVPTSATIVHPESNGVRQHYSTKTTTLAPHVLSIKTRKTRQILLDSSLMGCLCTTDKTDTLPTQAAEGRERLDPPKNHQSHPFAESMTTACNRGSLTGREQCSLLLRMACPIPGVALTPVPRAREHAAVRPDLSKSARCASCFSYLACPDVSCPRMLFSAPSTGDLGAAGRGVIRWCCCRCCCCCSYPIFVKKKGLPRSFIGHEQAPPPFFDGITKIKRYAKTATHRSARQHHDNTQKAVPYHILYGIAHPSSSRLPPVYDPNDPIMLHCAPP